MKTIRMPRRMGEITERLPAPQYDTQSAAVKRTVSQPHLPLEDFNKKPMLQKPHHSA